LLSIDQPPSNLLMVNKGQHDWLSLILSYDGTSGDLASHPIEVAVDGQPATVGAARGGLESCLDVPVLWRVLRRSSSTTRPGLRAGSVRRISAAAFQARKIGSTSSRVL